MLAACATDSRRTFDGAPAGRVDFANWPLYLDRTVVKGQSFAHRCRSSRRRRGIEVNYREVIPDAEVFYQEILPYLAAGKPTGWDIAVITNGVTSRR